MIALLAIGVPVLALVGWFSIPASRFNGHYADVAVQQGDLLVPVLILCLEALRRWIWEVKGGAWWIKIGRFVAPAWCALVAFGCVIGFFYATAEKSSADSGRSIAVITLVSLASAAILGTCAVILVGVAIGQESAPTQEQAPTQEPIL